MDKTEKDKSRPKRIWYKRFFSLNNRYITTGIFKANEKDEILIFPANPLFAIDLFSNCPSLITLSKTE